MYFSASALWNNIYNGGLFVPSSSIYAFRARRSKWAYDREVYPSACFISEAAEAFTAYRRFIVAPAVTVGNSMFCQRTASRISFESHNKLREFVKRH
jgi:hypothetical protein